MTVRMVSEDGPPDLLKGDELAVFLGAAGWGLALYLEPVDGDLHLIAVWEDDGWGPLGLSADGDMTHDWVFG